MKKLIKIVLLMSLTLIVSGCLKQNKPIARTVDYSLPIVREFQSLGDMGEIAFEWEPIYEQRIKGYKLYRYEPKIAKYVAIATINSKYKSHYVDYGLQSGVKYSYKITCFTDKFESKPSIPINATTFLLERLPYVRTVLNLPNMIKLIWRPHPDTHVIGYVIERKSAKSKNKWVVVMEKVGRLHAEFLDYDVKAGHKYYYRIKAKVNNNILSRPSKPVLGTTKARPRSIRGVKASTNFADRVELIWHNAQRDVLFYKVYREKTSFLDQQRMIAKIRTLNYIDRDLKKGEGANYFVTAVDKTGLESEMQSKPIFGSVLGLPPAPVILEEQCHIDGNGAVIVWRKSDDIRIKSYKVIRMSEGRNIAMQEFINIKENFYKDRDVERGVRYSYEVIAVDKSGEFSEVSKKINLRIAIGS